MWRIAGHLTRGLAMIWAVTTFTFVLIRLMPGDPVQVQYERLIAQGMTPDQAESATAITYGFVPHGPMWKQYLEYMWGLAHLDLGVSVESQGVPVADRVFGALPWTVLLVLSGILISFLIGVVLGVVAAMRRSTMVGHGLSIAGSLLHGVPPFVIGIVLAALFTRRWRWFPSGGHFNGDEVSPGFYYDFIGDVAYHAVLPAASFAVASYGGWLLAMRSSVASVLGDDFLLAAELRGLRPFMRFRYLARNAILPLFTVLAISFGLVFGGSIFIERIFNYPGLGMLLYQSIGARDFSMMSGAFLLITAAVIVANILADVLYTVIDPRVRRQA
ncbi:ABC transporter permease [Allorhizocola rhizosphaerae]|uniref:ABC transporter permease n=1 Tax=Allorhizocola rhizosphaerae TaxID=1872709 RepID=UPI001FE702BE|nr:ABC transporter permease [Allorhizocola rhizosphaerae]